MSDSANQKTYALFANPASRKIISALENSSADVKLFPPIETEKVILNEENIENLKHLKKFDWLIFTDVLAVDYFLANLEENEVDFFELDYLRVCAVGESIADRLRFSSVHSDVIPETVETDVVLAAIIDYVGEEELNNLRFLFPKEVSTNEELTEKLNTKGAIVSEMPVYQVIISHNLEITKLKILLKGGAIDEFIFAAPTDFIALKHYFKSEKVEEVLAEIRVSSADGVMFQCVMENNLLRAGLFHLAKIDKVKK